MTQPTPDKIMQLGMGFWASKTFLTAIGFGLFTELARQPLDADDLRRRLGLHERAARDFFDALVALGVLEREDGIYRNSDEVNFFLDKNKSSYVGGILEMANDRLFGFWNHLDEALRTGEPQNEAKGGGDVFAELYAHPKRLRGFLEAMSGISMGSAIALCGRFPWSEYNTFCDIGSARGVMAAELARAHEHLTGIGYDLEPVGPVFDEYMRARGVADRVTFQTGDFFKDEKFPAADVYIMGHILHDWDLDQKMHLLQMAHDSLADGGVLIVYENIIDDERKRNAMGLLMSLNMLIETPGGFDFTGAQCQAWMKEAGFGETRVEHLVGPVSMVVAIK